jgi:hypothetical protein
MQRGRLKWLVQSQSSHQATLGGTASQCHVAPSLAKHQVNRCGRENDIFERNENCIMHNARALRAFTRFMDCLERPEMLNA